MIEKVLNPLISLNQVKHFLLLNEKGEPLDSSVDINQVEYKDEVLTFINFLKTAEIEVKRFKILYMEGIILVYNIANGILILLTEPDMDVKTADIIMEKLTPRIEKYVYLTQVENWKKVGIIFSKKTKAGKIKVNKDFLKNWAKETRISKPHEIELLTHEMEIFKFKIEVIREDTKNLIINPEDGKKMNINEGDTLIAHLIEGISEVEGFFK